MSGRKYLFVHCKGKWDGKSYVGGLQTAFQIRDEEGYSLTRLVYDINLILKSEFKLDEHQFFEIISLHGTPWRAFIKDDEDLNSLLRSYEKPEIFMSHKIYQPDCLPLECDAVVGSCATVPTKRDNMGFVHLLETFDAMKRPPPNHTHLNDILGSEEKEKLVGIEDDHMDSSSEDSSCDSLNFEPFENLSDIPPENHTSTSNDVPLVDVDLHNNFLEIDDDTDDSSSDSSHDSLDYDSFQNPSSSPTELEMHTPDSKRQWIVSGIPSPSTCPSVNKEDKTAKVSNVAPDPIISLESIFTSKSEMCMLVGTYHLLNRVEYRVKKSDPRRWHLKCVNPNCQFVFHGIGKDDFYSVSKFKPHTCLSDPDKNSRRNLPSKVIASFYAAGQQDPATAKLPRSIMKDLKINHGLEISYRRALISKHLADDMIYGDSNASFEMLPAYLHELKVANPGTFAKIETDEQGKFKYVFFALGASIKGFVKYGRPVIVIDGTHLKGKYKGVVFVAVTQDANHRVFPIATGVGDLENNESWSWFLDRLKDAIGHDYHKDLLIVSDQHKSIIHAVKTVFPRAKHGLCYYHLQKKLAPYGKKVVQIFHAAAYEYRPSKYRKIISFLGKIGDGKIAKTLENAKPERWSRVHCKTRRYEFMTSNAAESFNKSLKWARAKPIVYVLESIRDLTQQWFHTRSNEVNSSGSVLCSRVAADLSSSLTIAEKYTVSKLTNRRYRIVCGTKSHIVDLSNCKCDCCYFQLEGIPCTHAIAAISHAGYPISIFCEEFYKEDRVKGMWKETIMPVPSPDEWVTPDDVKSFVCKAPPCPNQAGRPKTGRKKSALESSSSKLKKKRSRCSICRGTNHNRSTCKINPPIVTMVEDAESCDAVVTPKKPKVRRCSLCRASDHTKRQCLKPPVT